MAHGRTLTLAAIVAAGLAGPAAAQDTIDVAYTGGADAAALFISIADGGFAKAGVTVKSTRIPIMPNMPAALLSNSVQIGAMTATVLIQAAEGGLDLVAVSGSTVTSKKVHNLGVVVRTGETYKSPKDLIGKKVGVPGFGAYAHVVTRRWLTDSGVDPKQVDFVELTLPSMADALRSNSVDAAVAVDPFLDRVVASKAGFQAVSLVDSMPEDKPVILYAATRQWAESHPKELAAFRAGIEAGSKVVVNDVDKARAIVAEATKVPPAVAKTFQMGFPAPKIRADQIAWWIGVMEKQDMLEKKLDAAKLVAK
jgi:NitT/TauT family transport system substrate-binding protein